MQQPVKSADVDAKLIWRRLELRDIEALVSIADTIHPGLPERTEVFAERVILFPAGCLALVDDQSDKLYGYAISLPIAYRQPPALDVLLGRLPTEADQYYIHDVAILPEHQGKGYARCCVETLLVIADGYATTSLVSVYGTAPFWQRYGFMRVEPDGELVTKLLNYGEDAVFLERRNQIV
ncbi:hypothetical protein DE146DRAFT_748665 [Phaeosphaeria sp. MPI-PUGE-AT-0046c]|nr:hypothetical protein DE146DRAFT_748665 [Phaeosphaeria sp. MPI-PUGE-AT-0046c]